MINFISLFRQQISGYEIRFLSDIKAETFYSFVSLLSLFHQKCHAQGMQFCEINLATSVKRFSLISFIRFLLAVTFHPYPPHPQTTNPAAKVLIGGIK